MEPFCSANYYLYVYESYTWSAAYCTVVHRANKLLKIYCTTTIRSLKLVLCSHVSSVLSSVHFKVTMCVILSGIYYFHFGHLVVWAPIRSQIASMSCDLTFNRLDLVEFWITFLLSSPSLFAFDSNLIFLRNAR